MDIKVLRRTIELDLHEKFPTPSLEQRQVIRSVMGLLAEAEKRSDATTPQISWMDSSFMGFSFDVDADRASPRRDSDRKSNVDDLLDFIRKNNWTGGN